MAHSVRFTRHTAQDVSEQQLGGSLAASPSGLFELACVNSSVQKAGLSAPSAHWVTSRQLVISSASSGLPATWRRSRRRSMERARTRSSMPSGALAWNSVRLLPSARARPHAERQNGALFSGAAAWPANHMRARLLLCYRTALITLQAPTPGTHLSPMSRFAHETAGRAGCAGAPQHSHVLQPAARASSACGQPGSAAGPWSSSRSRSPMNASPGHPQMSTACGSRASQHVVPGTCC